MNQKGFTLLEVLVAVAITGVIIVSLIISVNQIVEGTVRSGSDVKVLNDVNQASLILKKDIIMAQQSDLSATPQSTATFDWVDYSAFQSSSYTSHSVTYALSGTDLMRTYDGVTTIAGRNISEVSFTQVERLITVTITAFSLGAEAKTETLTFFAYVRAEGLE